VLLVNTSQVGSTSAGGTGFQQLFNHDLAADTLGADGEVLEIETWGTFAANSNFKQIQLRFGGAVVADSRLSSLNGYTWRARATVVRTAPATQVAMGLGAVSSDTLPQSNNFLASQSPTADTTMPISFEVMAKTHSFAGPGFAGNNNDAVLKGVLIRKIAAP